MTDNPLAHSNSDPWNSLTTLPEGWANAKISELFNAWGGATPSKLERRFWNGNVPWISSKDIKEATITIGTHFVTKPAVTETRLRICPPGSVLVVVRSGILAHTLPVALTTRKVVINQDLKAFHCSENGLNEWLAVSLRANAPEILRANRKDGTTVQSINFDELKARFIEVPPLPEQKRIVAKIEDLLKRVDAARGRLAKVPAILKRFRQSVLAAACTGQLTTDWRETTTVSETGRDAIKEIKEQRKKANEQAFSNWREIGGPRPRSVEFFYTEETNLSQNIPADWGICTIGTIFSVETGATPLRKRKGEFYDGGSIPWVKTGEVQNEDIFKSEEKITNAAIADTNAKIFPINTILIAMYGEGKTRGQVGRLKIEAATNQACAALVNSSLPDILNRFVFYYCLSQYQTIRDQAVGGNQPNLNLDKIKRWIIHIPPCIEQHEIVRRVDALFALADRIEQRIKSASDRIEKLTQSILSRAFRGELVETEAERARRECRSYETAAQLLERIKSEMEQPPVSRAGSRTRRRTAARKKK